MSESGMRQRVISELRLINAIAVENPVLPGTPDVNYVEGWIELKWLRSWPVQDGVVNIPHFTRQQRVWHYRRRKAGGRSFFLLQCRKEWLLLDGAMAAMVVNKCTREELIEVSQAYWSDGLKAYELIMHLQSPVTPWSPTLEEIERLRG